MNKQYVTADELVETLGVSKGKVRSSHYQQTYQVSLVGNDQAGQNQVRHPL